MALLLSLFIHSFIHPTAFHLAWVSLWGYFSKQTVFWSGGGRWHPSVLWSQVSASVTCCSLVSTFSLPRLPEAHVEQSLPLGWLLCHGTPGAFFIAFNNPENPLACLCYYYLCLCYYLHLLSIFLYHSGVPTRTWISLILFPIVSLTPVCLTSSRNPGSWMNDSRNKWTDSNQRICWCLRAWGESVYSTFLPDSLCSSRPLWLWFCRGWRHSTGQLSTTGLSTPKCCWRRGQTPPLWIKTLKQLSTGQSRWEISQ